MSEGASVHVHFGGGKLGLGLIIPLTAKNFRVKILNKDNIKNRAKNEKLSSGIYSISHNEQSIRFDELITFGNEFESDIVDKISAPEVRLVTTAVGEPNLRIVAKNISKIIKNRNQKSINQPLIVIACENVRDNSATLREYVTKEISDADKKYMESHVYFCNCVVDRICYDIDADSITLKVFVGEEHEWVIDTDAIRDKNLKEWFSQKMRNEHIRLVNSDKLEFEQDLKLWCFNGVHLILAAYAKLWANKLGKANYPLSGALNVGFVSDPINRLQRILSVVMKETYQIDQKIMKKYHDDFKRRIYANKIDSANRIIHDLIDSVTDSDMYDLFTFLEKIRYRIMAPISTAVDLKHAHDQNKIKLSKSQLKDCSTTYYVLLSTIRSELEKKYFGRIFN